MKYKKEEGYILIRESAFEELCNQGQRLNDIGLLIQVFMTIEKTRCDSEIIYSVDINDIATEFDENNMTSKQLYKKLKSYKRGIIRLCKLGHFKYHGTSECGNYIKLEPISEYIKLP